MKTNNSTPVKKAGGFYVGLSAVILCVAAAIVYGTQFSVISYKEPVFNINICILLGVVSAVSLVMLFIPKISAYAPVVLCVGSGISFLMYVKMVIWPVSDTLYGIEPFPYMDAVITCAVLFVLSFVLAEVSLYMKKTKA